MVHGSIDPHLVIDHIDGNKTNNSIFNLRWVTKSENIKNSFLNGQNKTPYDRILKMTRASAKKRLENKQQVSF